MDAGVHFFASFERLGRCWAAAGAALVAWLLGEAQLGRKLYNYYFKKRRMFHADAPAPAYSLE